MLNVQAIRDGVDVLTLSVGPDEPPEDRVTFLSMFDVFMLYARRAGVFVVQAAGNRGPDPSSVVSYSPWAVGVASSGTDRIYPSSIALGNGERIEGVGLSGTYTNISASRSCLLDHVSIVTGIDRSCCFFLFRTDFWI